MCKWESRGDLRYPVTPPISKRHLTCNHLALKIIHSSSFRFPGVISRFRVKPEGLWVRETTILKDGHAFCLETQPVDGRENCAKLYSIAMQVSASPISRVPKEPQSSSTLDLGEAPSLRLEETAWQFQNGTWHPMAGNSQSRGDWPTHLALIARHLRLRCTQLLCFVSTSFKIFITSNGGKRFYWQGRSKREPDRLSQTWQTSCVS